MHRQSAVQNFDPCVEAFLRVVVAVGGSVFLLKI